MLKKKNKIDSHYCRYPHRILYNDDPYTGQAKAEYGRNQKRSKTMVGFRKRYRALADSFNRSCSLHRSYRYLDDKR